MPTALALSPHLDDAAFSCGGTLATLERAQWRVLMVTVFTGSVADPQGFALACQTDKGLSPEVDYMALRRDEDRAAARALLIERPRHLGFREAPHRGYASAPELFGEVRPDDSIVPELAAAFRDLIDETQPDLLLAPQAIGGHVDHVQVVRALQASVSQRPILWWRDFPYTVRTQAPKEPLRAHFAELPVRTIRFDRGAEVRKEAACAAYASQLGFQFGGRPGLRERLARESGVERFRLSGMLPAGIAGLVTADAAS